VTAIAYETVTSPQGSLPLLTPMSEVATGMAPHVGARCLEKRMRAACCLAACPGVPPADVVILGGGVAGTHAAVISVGMGATGHRWSTASGSVAADLQSARRAACVPCSRPAIRSSGVPARHLVIGTVLVPGAAAPKLITAETSRR